MGLNRDLAFAEEKRLPTINMWQSPWGAFVIPEDVPAWQFYFTKSGWFDYRRKITPQLEKYFQDMELRQADGLPVLTWAQWKTT
jgi:hypothetical protein